MSAQKHSNTSPRRSIQRKTPLGTMRTPSRPSGLYSRSTSCFPRVRDDLLCDRNNATKVAAVNDKVGGCALRYNAGVVDRVDGRDLGDDRRDGKRWQR